MASRRADADSSLLDRIYEAGAIPELWPAVLTEIARITRGIGAVFIVPRLGRFVATPGLQEMMTEFAASGLAGDNERTRRLLARNHPGFITDQDVFTLEEIPHSPVHRDFFIPRGGGYGVATVIPSPSGDTMIFHAERRFVDGPIERAIVASLDTLRPHLARASLLSSRMELRRLTAAAAALELIGLAAAVVGRGGRLLAVNQPFDRLIPSVIQDRPSRVALVNERADRLLADALREMASRPLGNRVRSIPIPAGDGRPPAVVHLLPVRGIANDVFASADAILVVTMVVPREVPTASVVQGLFDLTPTEALVARAIGNGQTTAGIATALGRSVGTVRSQVKSILAKTGLHRTADLVGLLRGMPFA